MPPRNMNWADIDDDYDLPTPEITEDPATGIKTIVEYRIDGGKKVKITRRIRSTIIKEKVKHAVAERKKWAKFGLEKGRKEGPDLSTTTVAENMNIKFSIGWSKNKKEETSDDKTMLDKLKDKKVTCRICKGDHFTTRCPYKESMPTEDASVCDPNPEPELSGGGGSRYIAPHMRAGSKRDAAGDSMYRRDRDDSTTLRVTNVSEDATDEDLKVLFGRYGPVTRAFVGKDHATGRGKGFAFINFADRDSATKACEKMDGFGYDNLILRVEFSKARE
ncbi:Eukaryotic translation initiation factor 3 subunit G [Neolecta irregularis DAH-3]|uniref:Eukaryotic translation initiation factor 3 subunit G n=1 Tax=Neolecta irregularis (strain DAH-3) TaxID=1198029 RepID=A0A1U7LQM2_NEOID|nr:Eukaryotic translation initiation factor 3 subunit G [Neolecta irregularis DAH-3]|eukprot:OLL24957.1 Eukaryotic translation initiation factor 3 subunit G [Neolecta irregularis DAH-3]